MSLAVQESFKENTLITGKVTMSKTMERQSLMPLANSVNRLIGKPAVAGKKSAHKIPFRKEPIKIYEDKKPSPPIETSTQTDSLLLLEEGTQTDVTGTTGIPSNSSDLHNDSGVGSGEFDQAYELMVKEPIPESYWRDLAEERRLSLAEALVENEQLHQSMEEMKEDIQNLSLLASQAEELAAVLDTALGDENNESENEENNAEAAPTEDAENSEDKVVIEETKEESDSNIKDVSDITQEEKETE